MHVVLILFLRHVEVEVFITNNFKSDKEHAQSSSILENLENRVSLASYDYNLSINGPMHFNYICDISKWKSGNYVIHISDGITIVKRIITIN